MISVITYNIQYGRKLEKIALWLKNQEKRYDILCLQEFPHSEIQRFLTTLQPTSYDFKFSRGFMKKQKEYGQLTIFNTKIQCLQNNIVELGASFFEEKIYKNIGSRSALFTILQNNKRNILVVNVHLICLALNKKRIAQLRVIMGRVIELTKNNTMPVIIVGDFNYSSLLRQKVLLRFMQEYGFKNAYKISTHRIFYRHHQVDYVFYKNCYVEETNVTRLAFSDHYPVEFVLND